MPRYVAFLRAINVGGHTVKMDALRRLFEGMGFADVSTFIASGNVLFESDAEDAAELERRIEGGLREVLGYEVSTFLRTDAQVAEVAGVEPFLGAEAPEGDRRHVVFLKEAPDAEKRKQVLALASEQDLLALHGRELHWLRRGMLMDSMIEEKDFRRALGNAPTTARNLNTVRKLAAKLTSG